MGSLEPDVLLCIGGGGGGMQRDDRPTILCLTAGSGDPALARVLQAARHELQVLCVSDIQAARDRAGAAWCVLLVQRQVSPLTIGHVLKLRGTAPDLPCVVVTAHDSHAERACATLDVPFLWLDRAFEERLIGAVRRARGVGVRASIRLQARVNTQLNALSCRAIITAADAEKTVRTVAELAHAIGASRSALWEAWRVNGASSTVQVPRRLRLEDFVDWLLLIEAMARKDRARNWAGVAESLGVHKDTVRRIAKRLTGLRIRDLEKQSLLLLTDAEVAVMLLRFGLGTHDWTEGVSQSVSSSGRSAVERTFCY